MKIKYRNYLNNITIPKKINIKVPGWVGGKDYKDPEPWHCKPFIDSCKYGYELVYPFEGDLIVKKINGKIEFKSENKSCLNYVEQFSDNYYSMSSFLDISPPENFLTRIEPHPRYYTDTTGNCPIAVCGHLKRFWARVFFIVFKSPLEGQKHIFRYMEPHSTLLFIPELSDFELEPMSFDEIKSRENIEKIISEKGDKICTHKWVDTKGNNFNNKYKVLNQIYEKGGLNLVEKKLEKLDLGKKIKIFKRFFNYKKSK